MATQPTPMQAPQFPNPNAPPQTQQPTQVKQKRKRSPSVAKPAFFIVQVLDEQGQPTQFDKKRIKIVGVERNAEQVMELVEGGEHPYAFYLRGIVPVARTTSPRSSPPSAA